VNKRLLYIAFFREDSESVGFKNKVYAQCRVFRNSGFEVSLVLPRYDRLVLYKIDPEGKGDVEREYIHSSNAVHRTTSSKLRSLIRKVRRFREIVLFLSEVVRNINPDVIYMRRPRLFRSLVKFIRYTSKHIPTLYEFPTWPWEKEFIRTEGILSFIYEFMCFMMIKNSLSGIVKIQTDRRHEDRLSLQNGVDVSKIPVRSSKILQKNVDLQILGVATLAKWHGYDRLIEGIRNYIDITGKDNVVFHVVGDGAERPFLEERVKQLHLEKSVIFHGVKTGKELDELFDKCHIAVGSLGIHRKGLTQTSELKLREYCARGIPFICSSADADFPSDFPFQLKVPADERPIDLNIVSSFADRALSDTDYSVKMREYAEENLDWSIKMKKLIDFMNEILESKVRR